MTANELKRRLEKAGCWMEEGNKALDRSLQGQPHNDPAPSVQGNQNGHIPPHPKATGHTNKVKIHMEYPARFEPAEEGGFVITIPDFGWGVSQADTEEEAREMATALLQTLVQEHINNGRDLPRPSRSHGRRRRMVRLSALQTAKAELYRQFHAAGIRKSELARRLGVPKTSLDRLFDLRHQSRLNQIEAAFRALGKEINIAIRDAA